MEELKVMNKRECIYNVLEKRKGKKEKKLQVRAYWALTGLTT
jgi:hypothetical protein